MVWADWPVYTRYSGYHFLLDLILYSFLLSFNRSFLALPIAVPDKIRGALEFHFRNSQE